MEKTLSIIKPDGFKRALIGEIITRLEKNNIEIIAAKVVRMTKQDAKNFYYVHKERIFFESLTTFMSSGPSFIMVLKGDKVIEKYRKIMGDTDHLKAMNGTIRKDFATDIEKNIVHGSDSLKSAIFEISFFFNSFELSS